MSEVQEQKPEEKPEEKTEENAKEEQKETKSQNQDKEKRTNDHHWVRGNGKSNYRWRYTYESTDESIKNATKARKHVGRVFHCYAGDVEDLAQRILKNTYATVGAVPLMLSFFNGKGWEEFEQGVPSFIEECIFNGDKLASEQ